MISASAAVLAVEETLELPLGHERHLLRSQRSVVEEPQAGGCRAEGQPVRVFEACARYHVRKRDKLCEKRGVAEFPGPQKLSTHK
jgi:hypothetical protein